MKWVRCVYNGGFKTLTTGKIYEVLSFINLFIIDTTRICIINDLGKKDYFVLGGIDGFIWFEDATDQIRDNKINQILNEVG